MRIFVGLFAALVLGAFGAAAPASAAESPGKVGGAVTNSVTSQGLDGARVTITNPKTGGVTTTQTDASGHYLVDVPAGKYTVRVAVAHYTGAEGSVTVVKLQTVAADFALVQLGRIAGYLVNTAGVRVVGTVSATGADQVTRSVDTNGTGDYVLEVPPGNHIVVFIAIGYATEFYRDAYRFEDATPVVVTRNVTTSANGRLAKMGHITGRITNADGDPLPGIAVHGQNTSGGSFSAATETDGTYSSPELHPGATWRLSFTDPDASYVTEYYANASSLGAAKPLSVPAAKTVTANARLARGGAITGMVRTAVGAAIGGSVDVYSGDTLVATVMTSTGAYRVGALHTGSYTVRFRSGDYAVQWYDHAATSADARPVSVQAGGTRANVDAALTSTTGAVGGTVTDMNGNTLPGIRVELYIGGASPALSRLVTSGPGGDFLFSAVPQGSYKLFFRDPAAVWRNEWYANKPSFSTATVVTVAPEVTTVVTNRLQPAGT